MRRLPPSLPVLLLGAVCSSGVGAACGGKRGPAPAMVLLVSDGDELSLVQRLSRIQLVFDAAEGFAGSLQPGPSDSGHEALDVDGDGQLEILLTVDVGGRDSLPEVRINPGSNRETPIAVRAAGLDREQKVVAYGGAPPQKLFVAGEMNTVYVPFKLSRRWQPIRLVAAAPRRAPRGQGLASVAIHLSRPPDPATLHTGLRVYFYADDPTDDAAGQGYEQLVDGIFSGPFTCGFETELWLFEPSRCLTRTAPGGYIRVVVGEGLADELGAAAQRSAATDTGSAFIIGFTAGAASDPVHFGPCAAVAACDGDASSGWLAGRDLACNVDSGLYEPALCSLSAQACVAPVDVFASEPDTSEQQCLAARPDAQLVGGSCVATARFACNLDADCATVGGERCNDSTGLCEQQACTDSCENETLACSPQGRCVPRLGGCVEDCRAFQACPDLSQACVTAGLDAGRCR